jgi:hypothetical protein
MIHQVDADGVVLVHRESDLQLRPDAVDAGDENGIPDTSEARGKKTAEPANPRENFGPVCLPNERLDSALQAIAQIDIDARPGIRLSFVL